MNTSNDHKWDMDKLGSDLIAFLQQLRDESDRGSVVVAAALLDEALSNILLGSFVPSPQREDELFDGAYAPLSSFSAKIDFAYRIGLLRIEVRSSLHLIRRIRNDFAHSLVRNGFSAPSVQSRLRELFKLNKPILNSILELINKSDEEILLNSFKEVDLTKGIQGFIDVMSWRFTFDMLAAIIASALQQIPAQVEPLKPQYKI